MAKLTDKKIKWIINKKKEGLSTKVIALSQKVSESRVRQLWSYYKKTQEIPTLKKPGKKPRAIDPEIINIVLESYSEYKCGPLSLERKIEKERKIHIPHNTIYKIMKKQGLVKPNPKKQKQRKYVRWERKHSNSLWHGDWKLINLNGVEKWLIAFMDDASRMITCYGLYDSPTTKNTIETLKRGFKEFGKPLQILTDRGAQFYANRKDKNGNATSEFTKFLESEGIQHIVARVNHPQTNGKIERWFGLLENKIELFNYNIDEFVHWYNTIKPHMSLWFELAETPVEAFFRKMRSEALVGWFFEKIV